MLSIIRYCTLIFILCTSFACSTKKNKQKVVQVNLKPTPLPVSGPTKKSTFFVNKAKKYGLENIQAARLYAVDFSGDGISDLVILPDFYSAPQFYEFNYKKKKFVKIKYEPFKEVVNASYLVFTDLNKDGVEDVIVGILSQKTDLRLPALRLFKGKRKKYKISFEEVPFNFKLDNIPLASLTQLDFNLDGYLDLFLGNWFKISTKGHEPMVDNLLMGSRKFKFKDVSNLLIGENEFNQTEEFFMNAAPTYGTSLCDINRDGYPDILTASTNGYSNKFWINQKGKQFIDMASQLGYAADEEGSKQLRGGGNTFFSACADFNNDSLIDIYVGEISKKYDLPTVDRSSILTRVSRNFPRKFQRSVYIDQKKGKWLQSDKRAIWVDLNFDGLQDLIVENSGFPPLTRLIYFEQLQDHTFEKRGEVYGLNILNPSGTIIMDVNFDGRPDVLTGQSDVRGKFIKKKLWLFENNLPRDGKKVLKVRLRGKFSNTFAIGADVKLKTSKWTQMRFVEFSQGGTPSQNEGFLFFGLAKDEKVENIVVHWPVLKNPQKIKSKKIMKKYDLSKLDFSQYATVTLCENGVMFNGARTCP